MIKTRSTLISSEHKIKLLTISRHIQCCPCPTSAHTEDTAKATRSHSWLIYTAAIQMRIAEDIWRFSNLCSCHQEMGRADPCHPHSASQTAPHLHPNLPQLTISVYHCVIHLLSKCQDKCSAATSPGWSWPALSPLGIMSCCPAARSPHWPVVWRLILLSYSSNDLRGTSPALQRQ